MRNRVYGRYSLAGDGLRKIGGAVDFAEVYGFVKESHYRGYGRSGIGCVMLFEMEFFTTLGVCHEKNARRRLREYALLLQKQALRFCTGSYNFRNRFAGKG